MGEALGRVLGWDRRDSEGGPLLDGLTEYIQGQLTVLELPTWDHTGTVKRTFIGNIEVDSNTVTHVQDLDEQVNDLNKTLADMAELLKEWDESKHPRGVGGKFGDGGGSSKPAALAKAIEQMSAFIKANPAKPVRPKWSDHGIHKYTDAIVAHYTPLIKQAMASSLPDTKKIAAEALRRSPSALKAEGIEPGKIVGEIVSTKDAGRASGSEEVARRLDQASNAHIAMDALNEAKIRAQELANLLRDLYVDSSLAATKVVEEQLGIDMTSISKFGQALANMDWSAWKPGDPAAAANLDEKTLQGLLDQANVTIKDLDETTISRLQDVLSEGLTNGDSVDSMAQGMNEVLDDPARADLIALTETARAQSDATMEGYQDAGLGRWEWLSEDDERTCDPCVSNDGMVFDVGNDDPRQPLHPRCRCVMLPVVDAFADDNSLNTVSPEDEGGQDDGQGSEEQPANGA